MFPFNTNYQQHQQSSSTPKPGVDDDEFKLYTPQNPLDQYPQITYKLPTTLEHLFEEEATRKGRNVTENLTFYTGTSLLLGSIIGGTKGTIQGLKEAERGDPLKIRVNRVLNSGGSVGRRVGCRLGFLGLIYGGVGMYRGVDDDDLGCVLTGALTGGLFRVFGGVRGVVVGGVVGGLLGLGFASVRRYVPSLDTRA